MPQSQLSRRVVKAMGVFGGVQMVSMVCSVVRTKLVALWLGSSGVGLFGVFNSTIDLIAQVSMLGLPSSGLREIARDSDPRRRAITVAVIKRWSLWLAIAGGLLTFLCAPLLSRWSFGDVGRADSFRWLSFGVALTVLASSRTGVLQGLGLFGKVARASIFASVCLTLAAIPLFYLLRLASIVPVVVASGAFMMIGVMLFREPRTADPVDIPRREVVARGKSLIVLGAYITVSTVITLLASYVLISWFNSRHGSDVAGLYQAGFTIVNRYMGLAFAAMVVEYFPRLASVSSHRLASEIYVSHEMKLALLVLVPCIGLMNVFSAPIIELFYSSRFVAVEPFVAVGAIGTVFRAISWCMAFTMLVKGDGPIYLLTETLSGILYVALNILVYDTLGIAGMGWAYIVWYAFYTVIVGCVYRWRYHMRLRRGLRRLAALAVIYSFAVMAATAWLGMWVGALLTLASILCSWTLLQPMLRRRPSRP